VLLLLPVLRIRIRMDSHQIERSDPDPHQSDKLDLDPDPQNFWQMTSQNVWNKSLFEQFFKGFEPLFGS
jgi:hypothetical protein